MTFRRILKGLQNSIRFIIEPTSKNRSMTSVGQPPHENVIGKRENMTVDKRR